MNNKERKNNKHKFDKIFWIVIIIYVLLGIGLALGFKYRVFELVAPSRLSNEGWASFLGSYVGGSLGGLGTLIAVYFTVKTSLDIQEENKRDSDQQMRDEIKRHNEEIANQKHAHDIERASDLAEEHKKECKAFVDRIAEELGVYITHISKYHYAGLYAERLEHNVFNKKINYDQGHNEASFQDYEEALEEQKDNSKFGNRLTANEMYFTILTKLENVDCADHFVQKMKDVHRGAGLDHKGEEKSYGSWISEQTDALRDEYRNFAKRYVNS